MAPKSARKAMPAAPNTTPIHMTPKQFPSARARVSPVDLPVADAPSLNYHTNINFWRGRQLSLLAALAGVAYTLRTQPNVWIEIAALSVVAIAGFWFGISALEWALLGLTVAMILALEAVNTSIESVVDLVSPHYHPLAKIAKDTAAGALVIAVLGSIFVAACIFGPRLWALVF